MMTTNKVMRLIDSTREEQGITKKDFARKSGIAENSYHNYLKGSKPNIEAVDRMLNVLGLTLTIGE